MSIVNVWYRETHNFTKFIGLPNVILTALVSLAIKMSSEHKHAIVRSKPVQKTLHCCYN